MKGVVIVFLYFLGVISTVLFGIYIFALILFVFGDTSYPGEIAFLPKWIFLFCLLVFLGKTKTIQKIINKFVDNFEKVNDLFERKMNHFNNKFFD